MNPLVEIDWQASALCRRHPHPDYWFPERDSDGKIRYIQTHEAKTICHLCPVFEMCRQAAVDRGEKYGIWAGEDMATARGQRNIHGATRRPPVREVAVLYSYLLVDIPEPIPVRKNGPLTA